MIPRWLANGGPAAAWTRYLGSLAVLSAGVWLLATFYWDFGVLRLALLAALVLFVLALRRWHRPPQPLHGGTLLRVALAFLLLGLGLSEARTLRQATHAALATGRLRLDEGRTTLRAAQLLWRGENPYATGALVDDTAFLARLPLRQAAGVGPALPAAQVEATLDRYLGSLDATTRRALLPAAPPGADATARREVAVLGYKYGPVPLLLTAALWPAAGAAAVPLSNGLACLGLFAVLGAILLEAGAGTAAAGVAVAALMLDPLDSYYFVQWTATDVWPLLFGFLALLCALRRWHAGLGIALALALASKILPGALFLLLLPAARSWRAAAWAAASAAVLLLPWLVLDARGFLHDVVLWGTLMAPASNSWAFSAPPGLVLAVRAALLLPLGWLAWRIAWRREPQMASGFALLAMLLIAGGAAMHNNYVPWFSTWIVLAIAEAVCLPRPLRDLLAGTAAAAVAGKPRPARRPAPAAS